MVLCKDCDSNYLCCEDCLHYRMVEVNDASSSVVIFCALYNDEGHNTNASLSLYCDDYHCKHRKDDKNVH